MRHFIYIVLVLASVALTRPACAATDEAERVFQAHGNAIYQIETIDLASGKKTSIGSGFQFTEDGLIATNYHVVAEAIQRPEDNRVTFVHETGERGNLKIVVADVTRDLAIVRMDNPGKMFLSLGTSKLAKGTKLFALGNPHDIGFTVIEGTYSGLAKESFIDKIHFSGSLNPGMSGGPAVSHDGRVVGINVATAGNQISFLVPVEPLQQLFERYKSAPADHDFMSHADKDIEEQLLRSQDHNIGKLLSTSWESMNFGPITVPGRMNAVVKCWGGTSHKEKDPYQHYYTTCSSQDRMFIDSDFDTSIIYYRYDYMTGKDELNLMRFYNLYEQQYIAATGEEDNAREGSVTNFVCNSRFIDTAGLRWKANFCTRQYKSYPQVYDAHLYMTAVGLGKKGFTVRLIAQGVSQKNSLALVEKFIREIKAPIAPQPEEKQ